MNRVVDFARNPLPLHPSLALALALSLTSNPFDNILASHLKPSNKPKKIYIQLREFWRIPLPLDALYRRSLRGQIGKFSRTNPRNKHFR